MNYVMQAASCFTAAAFTAEVENRLKRARPNEYLLVSVDLDNFKYINDLFGYALGDQVLHAIITHFPRFLTEGELFARVNADHFVFFARAADQAAACRRFLRMMDLEECLASVLPAHYNLVSSGGIFTIDDPFEKVSAMIDKANFARKQAKGNHVSTFFYFTQKMSDELSWKQQITLSMEDALANHEFEMYLQPKIIIKTGEVMGAEALVRWNSRQKGMIYPDQFIPVFEQNGFIKLLDFYMLRQACLFLTKCMQDGVALLPISVNFSKVHVGTPHFADQVLATVRQYGLSTELIEIELTENVFSRDFEALVAIADELRGFGFKVSLDDFGSAYSSLSYLKSFPVDIVKIDKGFLNTSTDTDKSRLIIGKIVEMIKSLCLTTVIEGVEDEEQLNFLQRLNCDIGQGYYFARPMPAEDYERFMQQSGKAAAFPAARVAADQPPQEKPPQAAIDDRTLSVLYHEKLAEVETLYANIPGGVLHCDAEDDFRIYYQNDGFLQLIGFDRQTISDRFQGRLVQLIPLSDRAAAVRAIKAQLANGRTARAEFRLLHRSGRPIWVLLQGQSLGGGSDARRLCCVLIDITAERESRDALRLSEQRYKIILEQSDDITFEWDFTTDTIIFSDKFEQLLGFCPITEHVSTNKKIFGRIHPDDLSVFQGWLESTFRQTSSASFEFRLRAADGRYIWIRSRSTAVCDSGGSPVKSIGVFTNIDAQKQAMDDLMQKSQQDSLTKLYNKQEARQCIERRLADIPPGGGAAMIIVDIDNFKGINDHLGHQFGDTVLVDISQKISRLFSPLDVVGRLGGDEFIILMRGVAGETAVVERAEQLLRALRSSYFGENQKYTVSGSVGIAYYPQHGDSFETLYRLADIALYQSKNGGKDRYTIYHPELAGARLGARTPMEAPDRFVANYFADDPIYNVFEMLYETQDIRTTINKILDMVGKRFHVDRVYIFEHTDDGKFSTNTYEWCAAAILPEMDNLQNLPVKELATFFAGYNSDGIFYCNDLKTLDPFSVETLTRQGIKSLLHCAIFNEGTMKGFIGFDDCTKERVWTGEEIAMLSYISKILSIFLLKKQISKELWNSYQNHTEMLDNLNGYVYVIDRNTYETLYLNKAMLALGAQVGEKCHCIAFERDTPCENCPARGLHANAPFATAEIYSLRLDSFVSSAASCLRWTDGKQAALICCTDISKYKRPR